MSYDFDFIGFTYNGKHSYNDFGVYRVIDGDRYTEDLVPQMNDKTADATGADGQYFFGTTHKTRQFSINIAFDNLTEEKFRAMRQWFDGKDVHDLIFDEAPYKVYSAKVTGTPQLKTICFSKDGVRIYKGEGTIQFTCFYPYAHTPNTKQNITTTPQSVEVGTTKLECGLIVWKGESIKNFLGRKLILQCILLEDKVEQEYIIDGLTTVVFDNSVFVKTIRTTTSGPIENFAIGIDSVNNISDQFVTFVYSTNNCFEVNNRYINFIDGKNINYYSISDYPTKMQWAYSFNPTLEKMIKNNNYGDISATFVVTKTQANKNTTFKVGECEITIGEDCSDFKWDSKTGLVTGKVAESGKIRPIKYTGKSYGTIPVGGLTEDGDINLNGANLEYNYWYY